MSIRSRVISIAAVAIATTMLAAPIVADEGAIAHRKAVMKAVGGHTGAIAAIVKGQVPFTDDIAGHAKALDDLAKISGKIFPDGSGDGDTDALPSIWEKPAEFRQAMETFQGAAANLAKVAEGGDRGAIAGALGDLGKACAGCHKPFRKDI